LQVFRAERRTEIFSRRVASTCEAGAGEKTSATVSRKSFDELSGP
jgi:hypothetical protein